MTGHSGAQEMCHTGDLVTCVSHTNDFVTTHHSEALSHHTTPHHTTPHHTTLKLWKHVTRKHCYTLQLPSVLCLSNPQLETDKQRMHLSFHQLSVVQRQNFYPAALVQANHSHSSHKYPLQLPGRQQGWVKTFTSTPGGAPSGNARTALLHALHTPETESRTQREDCQ